MPAHWPSAEYGLAEPERPLSSMCHGDARPDTAVANRRAVAEYADSDNARHLAARALSNGSVF